MPKFSEGQQVRVGPTTTHDALIGRTGTVYSVDDTEPYLYVVKIDGADWLFVEFELEAVEPTTTDYA
jgi:hypothetical protein